MSDPLLSREGHNYERQAILNWVAEHGTSPLTREPLKPSQLVSNKALQCRIKHFMKQNGITPEDHDDTAKNTDFVGYVFTEKKIEASSTGTVSLRSLAESTFTLTQSSWASNNDNGSPTDVPAVYLAIRRRQIADLIQSAMQDLNDL